MRLCAPAWLSPAGAADVPWRTNRRTRLAAHPLALGFWLALAPNRAQSRAENRAAISIVSSKSWGVSTAFASRHHRGGFNLQHGFVFDQSTDLYQGSWRANDTRPSAAAEPRTGKGSFFAVRHHERLRLPGFADKTGHGDDCQHIR